MKLIRTRDAVGQVLCHDMTQIIRGEFKGPRFRKGHIVTEEDIPILLSMGKENLFVWELAPGMLHENDAAERLCALCLGDGLSRGEVSEGKIELRAGRDGVFLVDSERLRLINAIDGIIIATRRGYTPVHMGDKLCGTRVIPLVIEQENLILAENVTLRQPLMEVHPYTLRKAGIITTGSEVAAGLIRDTFTPVLQDKLREFGISVTAHCTVDDDTEHIQNAIGSMHKQGLDLILCTGGMSVDPDDRTPGAIRSSGARIVTYGAPVLPGAMILLGYYNDGLPIVGLPGCVMYASATVFDKILPRLAAKVPLTKQDFVDMGEGGLCLGCKPCRYPDCPFAG